MDANDTYWLYRPAGSDFAADEGWRPAWLQKAKSFKDYYFGGDPEVIEAHFNLPQRRGSYDTWYGATVVGDQVVRVKQYCYDQQSVFSDWEVAYIALSKRINGTGEDDAST